MEQIILDAEAGELLAELARRGVAAHTVMHVTVEPSDANMQMAAITQSGNAFD